VVFTLTIVVVIIDSLPKVIVVQETMFPVYFALSFLIFPVRALKDSKAKYNSEVLTENWQQSTINGIYNLSSIAEVLPRSIPSNNLEAYMSTVT